jgi:hypothetical protein
MLVVIQFPIADARRFVNAPQSYLARPNWKVPQTGIVSDYVWGFGRVVPRSPGVDTPWTDEAAYALAASSIRFPGMTHELVAFASGASPAIITCCFRRLFHDGTCVARVEIGFDVRLSSAATGSLDGRTVVSYLLSLPSVVPEASKTKPTRQLAFQGSRLAARYHDASSPRQFRGASGKVGAGNPMVIVDSTDGLPVTLPELEDVSAATLGGISLGFALTRFAGAGVPTWYLGPGTGASADVVRNLRICLLRLHAEEEVLDRVVSWVDSGGLSYDAGTDAAGRLEDYIGRTTQLLDRKLLYAVPTSPISEAFDAVTKVNRRDVEAQRRAAFDGMRLQIRRKAEAFLAKRDAVRPQIWVGDYVEDKTVVHAHDITGSQIGSHNTQTISDSFNTFAAAHGKQDDLLEQMKSLSESVAALVNNLQAQDPNAAKEVTETFQSFAEESAKEAPKSGTLRALGRALIDAAKQVANVAVPVATAVAGVMRIFGIPIP